MVLKSSCVTFELSETQITEIISLMGGSWFLIVSWGFKKPMRGRGEEGKRIRIHSNSQRKSDSIPYMFCSFHLENLSLYDLIKKYLYARLGLPLCLNCNWRELEPGTSKKKA